MLCCCSTRVCQICQDDLGRRAGAMAQQAPRRVLQQLCYHGRLAWRSCAVDAVTGQGASPGNLAEQLLGFGASYRCISTGRQRSPYRSLKALMRDFKQLCKFKLSALVALTASAGFAAGSSESVDYAKLAWTSIGTLGAAACANTLNQLYEVVNDSRMARTCNRPLPAGRISKATAVVFAVFTGAAGLWVLSDKTNPLATSLGAANILLYAGVYTPLKQLSVWNTWVGAVVGAVPPLMGWAAAAGYLEPGAWVLAAALFSWQVRHLSGASAGPCDRPVRNAVYEEG
eukprot:GHRR01035143.1.p1 GENE.GHRR01035143.1~~GHRR01035143.1.p1  ORF type:complete len:286 (+),score=82.84 GHRR01035143.1:134-991(+)